MTTTSAQSALGIRANAASLPGLPIPVVIGVALVLGLALTWPRVVAVWTTGAFFDTDDAMRMVQVRDLIAGQGWFDMTAHRLDPPHGLLMHWSRIVDVPLVVLVRLFGLIAAPESAERLARFAFPLALQAGLYAGLAWCGGLLLGPSGRLVALTLGFLSGIMFGQFQPGRIDHHAPQIMLMVLVLGASLAALEPRRGRLAGLAGLLTALSLAISIENLPFFVVLDGGLVLTFVAYGTAMRLPLLWLAGGLALGLLLFFAATVPPSRALAGACDAFSAAHMVGGLVGAASMAALALGLPLWRTAAARAAAAIAAGGLTLLAVALTYPACLGDPLSGVDPLVREVWLRNVWEAMPLGRIAALRPGMLAIIALPVGLGLAAALWAVRQTNGLSRTRWALIAGLVAIGLITAFWQIRVFASAAPLAALPAAFAVLALADRLAGASSALTRAATTALLCLPFSSLAYAIVVPEKSGEPVIDGTFACLAPKALVPLAKLAPGVALAPIDSGSHLLSDTQLSVVAAPYHRNNAGNRLALEAFLAAPDAAEGIVRESGARYVIICPQQGEVEMLIKRAPRGLAASLARGETPAWLMPLPVTDTPFRVFELRPLS
ncbi:MAG: hypothetical protein NVSMB26_24880 [Beijerinckiaceae bacterium]